LVVLVKGELYTVHRNNTSWFRSFTLQQN